MELDNQSPETIEYKAITGIFGNVRYFITTLDHSDAVENIRFADEIQGSWSFSERVQRKSERNKALDDYYESHPKLTEIGTKALLKWFFTELQPFKDWVSQISYVGINLPIQPEQPRLSASQKASIKKLRDSSVLYTLLGQKILFFAVSRFLLGKLRVEYHIPAILDAVSLSITKMDRDGFFSRDQSHWSHVLVESNENLTIITKGSGFEKCIELVRMIFSNSSEGVRDLIKRTQKDVSSEVNWNEASISTWRKDFHVILPKVDFIDEQIKESSESDDSFAEVRDLLDSSEEDEEESDEIEDDEDIFKETEELKD
ncbi:hypothetical protein [Nostoc sp.]|uniref:hypothetical protein n=1 Tax=Nostoc sp. TaxID=1180 RepID=UPI002FF892B8